MIFNIHTLKLYKGSIMTKQSNSSSKTSTTDVKTFDWKDELINAGLLGSLTFVTTTMSATYISSNGISGISIGLLSGLGAGLITFLSRLCIVRGVKNE